MTTARDVLGTTSIFRFSTYENVLNFLSQSKRDTYKMTCDSKINLFRFVLSEFDCLTPNEHF